MKRFFLFAIFAFFPFLFLKAGDLQLTPIGPEKEKERALWLEGGHVIYFFTDQTVVYLRHPPYKDQTWKEWWDNIEPSQPDPQFYFQLTKWNSSPSFQLYRYQWSESPVPHILEPLFNDSKLASEYLYFIVNSETGEKTLCQILSLADLGAFITRYGKECYDKGYENGAESILRNIRPPS